MGRRPGSFPSDRRDLSGLLTPRPDLRGIIRVAKAPGADPSQAVILWRLLAGEGARLPGKKIRLSIGSRTKSALRELFEAYDRHPQRTIVDQVLLHLAQKLPEGYWETEHGGQDRFEGFLSEPDEIVRATVPMSAHSHAIVQDLEECGWSQAEAFAAATSEWMQDLAARRAALEERTDQISAGMAEVAELAEELRQRFPDDAAAMAVLRHVAEETSRAAEYRRRIGEPAAILTSAETAIDTWPRGTYVGLGLLRESDFLAPPAKLDTRRDAMLSKTTEEKTRNEFFTFLTEEYRSQTARANHMSTRAARDVTSRCGRIQRSLEVKLEEVFDVDDVDNACENLVAKIHRNAERFHIEGDETTGLNSLASAARRYADFVKARR